MFTLMQVVKATEISFHRFPCTPSTPRWYWAVPRACRRSRSSGRRSTARWRMTAFSAPVFFAAASSTNAFAMSARSFGSSPPRRSADRQAARAASGSGLARAARAFPSAAAISGSSGGAGASEGRGVGGLEGGGAGAPDAPTCGEPGRTALRPSDAPTDGAAATAGPSVVISPRQSFIVSMIFRNTPLIRGSSITSRISTQASREPSRVFTASFSFGLRAARSGRAFASSYRARDFARALSAPDNSSSTLLIRRRTSLFLIQQAPSGVSTS